MSYLDDEELKIGDIDDVEEDFGLDDDLGGPIHDDFNDDAEEDLGLADLNGSEY